MLILAIIAELRFHAGVKVVVENRGATPIRSLTVRVTGNAYALGDIAPGATQEATVNSTGESDVAIEFDDSTDRRH